MAIILSLLLVRLPSSFRNLVMEASKSMMNSDPNTIKLESYQPGMIEMPGIQIKLKQAVVAPRSYDIKGWAKSGEYLALLMNTSSATSRNNLVKNSVFIDPSDNKTYILNKYIGEENDCRVFQAQEIEPAKIFEMAGFSSDGYGCSPGSSGSIAQNCFADVSYKWDKANKRAELTKINDFLSVGVGGTINAKGSYDIKLTATTISGSIKASISSMFGGAFLLDNAIFDKSSQVLSELKIPVGTAFKYNLFYAEFSFGMFLIVRPEVKDIKLNMKEKIGYYKNYKFDASVDYIIGQSQNPWDVSFRNYRHGSFDSTVTPDQIESGFSISPNIFIGLSVGIDFLGSSIGFELGMDNSINIVGTKNCAKCGSPHYSGGMNVTSSAVIRVPEMSFLGVKLLSETKASEPVYTPQPEPSRCIADTSVTEEISYVYEDYKYFVIAGVFLFILMISMCCCCCCCSSPKKVVIIRRRKNAESV